MKKFTLLAIALLIAAAPAFAGGEKCTENAQACVNHWAKSKDKGWLGLKTDTGTDGSITVKETMAGSPAATAGFQAGDIVLTMNGASMTDKEAMKKAKGAWSVGQTVTYTVRRADTEQTMTATLAAMPEEVFASMVGHHMLENHVNMTTADAASSEKPAKETKTSKK